jgi:prophage antirepressor-like protein
MSNLSRFEFNSSEVRVLTIDGEQWFSIKDVLITLGSSDDDYLYDILSRLEDDEILLVTGPSIGLPEAKIVFMSVSGLCAVVLWISSPEANAFRKWVTSEVLPSIRKTGSYSVANTSIEAMLLEYTKVMEDHERRLTKVEAENQQMKERLAKVEAANQQIKEEIRQMEEKMEVVKMIWGPVNTYPDSAWN